MDLTRFLIEAVGRVEGWQHAWGPFETHPSMRVPEDRFRDVLAEYADRLRDNYPFFHPRYAGQMLKPPHPAAITGYLAAMLINPNNHALDGGPATGRMEKEVVRDLAAMFRLPDETLGHLTGGGTVANLEALWVARQLQPGRAVAVSEAAHYTHGRMGEVLGLEIVHIPADRNGRMRLDALEDALRTGRIGTVVATAGTTGLGAVDPIADVHALRERYGFRLHVDAAYGGFFTLLAWPADEPFLDPPVARHFRAIAEADSVAIDPHKHGLQPYGCGAILFRDPAVGQLYRHDSPYTYFTSDELHLGEISLECSRPGAAAGALWFTTRLLPLRSDEGLGPVLMASIRAARLWSQTVAAGGALRSYVEPELDIVTFFPEPGRPAASAVDEASSRLFTLGMNDEDNPVFLSLLRVAAETLEPCLDGFEPDRAQVRILRSVLMKPEHEHYVPALHAQLSALAERAARAA